MKFILATDTERKHFETHRRDSPVLCASCGRKVERRGRQQKFCSRRCRQKANYGEKVARGDFSTRTIARPTNPPKKAKRFNALQGAKTRSSIGIFAPADIIKAEVWGGRTWQSRTSADGIAVEVSRHRSRTLVSS